MSAQFVGNYRNQVFAHPVKFWHLVPLKAAFGVAEALKTKSATWDLGGRILADGLGIQSAFLSRCSRIWARTIRTLPGA